MTMIDNIYNREKQRFIANPPKNDFNKDTPVSEHDLNNISNSIIGLHAIVDKLFNTESEIANLNSNVKFEKNVQVSGQLSTDDKITINVGQGLDVTSLLTIFLMSDRRNGIAVQSQDGNLMELKDTDDYFGLFLNGSPFFALEKSSGSVYSSFDIKTSGKITSTSVESQSLTSQSVTITQSLTVENPEVDDSRNHIPANVQVTGSVSASSVSSQSVNTGTLSVTGTSTLNDVNFSGALSGDSISFGGKMTTSEDGLSLNIDKLTVSGDTMLQKTTVNGLLTSHNYDFGGFEHFRESNLDIAWQNKEAVGIEVNKGIITNIWKH